MVSRHQNSASSVVGLIFITNMIDNWRAVKSIMSATKTRGHRTSTHTNPQTKTWFLHLPDWVGKCQKKPVLTLSSTWDLASNICRASHHHPWPPHTLHSAGTGAHLSTNFKLIINTGWHWGFHYNILHASWMISNKPKGKLDIIHCKWSIFSHNPK